MGKNKIDGVKLKGTATPDSQEKVCEPECTEGKSTPSKTAEKFMKEINASISGYLKRVGKLLSASFTIERSNDYLFAQKELAVVQLQLNPLKPILTAQLAPHFQASLKEQID
ncbi:hypothetical protein TNCT_226321 [Trichonephila clavata]|uniref:Uncharacterized protein n=1 Tax=Trichonephila clavata TaxID=2740835 RepID=A0A8X6LP71_TRICU|nr:hypothetical protein TNCT_226321 [Trichonephila clavata]